LIEVRGLTKQYGEKTALDNVSFSIGGEILGLLGLNGAGKSTTMNILTGYISPTSGTVSIDGHDMQKEPKEAKSVIGYLPEQLAFYNDMRVNEYLDFVSDLKGIKKRDKKAQIDSACEKVGISHIKERLIRNLSKGYRQRVGFAQALLGDPKVLILDEPTVGLDPSQIIEIRSLIKEMGKNCTVIVSSHILSEIQAMCERVIVLHNGRVIADDTPENLAKAVRSSFRVAARIQGEKGAVEEALKAVPDIKSVKQLAQKEPGAYDYIIESGQERDIRADVFRALAKADLPMLYIYSDELSLEDVFLNLIDTNSRIHNGEGDMKK
jgi:ABC-2 type transport system ATP-binding protein